MAPYLDLSIDFANIFLNILLNWTLSWEESSQSNIIFGKEFLLAELEEENK